MVVLSMGCMPVTINRRILSYLSAKLSAFTIFLLDFPLIAASLECSYV